MFRTTGIQITIENAIISFFLKVIFHPVPGKRIISTYIIPQKPVLYGRLKVESVCVD